MCACAGTIGVDKVPFPFRLPFVIPPGCQVYFVLTIAYVASTKESHRFPWPVACESAKMTAKASSVVPGGTKNANTYIRSSTMANAFLARGAALFVAICNKCQANRGNSRLRLSTSATPETSRPHACMLLHSICLNVTLALKASL